MCCARVNGLASLVEVGVGSCLSLGVVAVLRIFVMVHDVVVVVGKIVGFYSNFDSLVVTLRTLTLVVGYGMMEEAAPCWNVMVAGRGFIDAKEEVAL